MFGVRFNLEVFEKKIGKPSAKIKLPHSVAQFDETLQFHHITVWENFTSEIPASLRMRAGFLLLQISAPLWRFFVLLNPIVVPRVAKVNDVSYIQPSPRRGFVPSPIKKARRQSENARLVGEALESVAVDSYQKAKAQISKVLDSDLQANGVLHNLEDKKGREYRCSVGFDFTNWRLSDGYQRKQARRHRNTLYKALMSRIDDVKAHNLKVCFFTPSFPNQVNFGMRQNSELHARAWEMFLKSGECRKFFLGGYSRIEFTEKSKTADISINYHNHALVILNQNIAFGNSFDLEGELSRLRIVGASVKVRRPFINSLQLARRWTKCIKRAYFELYGSRMKVKTLSGNCRVDFKEVNVSEIENYDPNEKQTGVLFELAGYTAKQANFVGLLKNEAKGAALLAEAEYVFRNKRILTGFGVFKAQPKATSSLLNEETYRQQSSSKNDVSACNYRTQTAKEKILRNGVENIDFSRNIVAKGSAMIELGLEAVWIQKLLEVKPRLIKYRREKLLESFPNAIFTDLTGEKYYGETAQLMLLRKEFATKVGLLCH